MGDIDFLSSDGRARGGEKAPHRDSEEDALLHVPPREALQPSGRPPSVAGPRPRRTHQKIWIAGMVLAAVLVIALLFLAFV